MIVRRLKIAAEIALFSMLRNPLRAGLTASGIWIGVLAVTVVMALGEGADRSIQIRMKSLGENLLTIVPRETLASGTMTSQGRLTDQDLLALRRDVKEVFAAAPAQTVSGRFASGKQNTTAQALGTTSEYFLVRDYAVKAGATWTPAQESTGARVALLGPTLVKNLFPDSPTPPIGEAVRISGSTFTVVGILAAKGETAFGSDQDNIALVPIKAAQGALGSGKRGEYQQILVKLTPEADSPGVQRKMTRLLRQNHGLQPEDADDFSIRDSARIAQAQKGVVTVMRTLLLAIGCISLVIGGIGVMNVMLVGVKERTREIGARLAIGAHPLDIMLQFLIEAVLLSLGGGLLGVVSALLLLPPLEAYFGWPLELSESSVVIATSVSMVVGVAFGLLPARRASVLDPADALRTE